MMRGILIFFSIILLLGVGVWTNMVARENARLTERVHYLEGRLKQLEAPATAAPPAPGPAVAAAGEPGALRAELEQAQQKLADLQARLDGARQPRQQNLAQANSEIDKLKPRLATLENDLAQLSDDSRTVRERSRAYRERQREGTRQSKAQVIQQIDTLKTQMLALQEQIKHEQATRAVPYRKKVVGDLRAQLEPLREQRRVLEAQLAALEQNQKQTAQAVNSEVNVEQGEVQDDRQAVLNELSDVKKQIQHWQSVRTASTGAVNEGELKVQIAETQARIQSLNAQIAGAR